MESTLSLTLTQLAIEVGGYLGYGRTPSNWSGWDVSNPFTPKDSTITVGLSTQTIPANDSQLGHIIACLNDGLDQFYHPPLSGDAVAYKWTFLEPTLQLTTVANKAQYDLPDDFAFFEGELAFDPSVGTWAPLRRYGEAFVRALIQRNPGMVGKPECAAILDKKSDGVLGQKKALLMFPTPDAAYPILGRYALLPNALTAANPYPLGGPAYRRAIIESCLAIAESRFQDELTTHRDMFADALTAAISQNVRERPEYFGYMGDASDGRDRWPQMTRWTTPATVTYNGAPVPQ